MSETRQYELAYVASPDLGEDGVTELHTQVEAIVTDLGGRVEKTDNWGRRRLAYEIGKHKEGTYIINLLEGPGTLVGELDRKLKVLDTVLRHLVVRVDEDLKKAQRARERRQQETQKRRVARGLPAVPPSPPPPATSTPGARAEATTASKPEATAAATTAPQPEAAAAATTALQPEAAAAATTAPQPEVTAAATTPTSSSPEGEVKE